MKHIKEILLVLILLTIGTVYLVSKENGTTPKDTEIKKDTEEILDTALDIKDSLKKMKTTINGKVINYGNNTSIKYIEKQIKNTHIHKKYFLNTTKCSQNCGVAIKKWDDAKKYCKIRGSRLPSKYQIENSNRYNKKECSDCSYWTNTEALRPNGKSYPSTKVYVYLQSDDDFLKFSTRSTYVATCLSN